MWMKKWKRKLSAFFAIVLLLNSFEIMNFSYAAEFIQTATSSEATNDSEHEEAGTPGEAQKPPKGTDSNSSIPPAGSLDEAEFPELPPLSALKSSSDRAQSFLFADEDLEKVEEKLGQKIRSAHEDESFLKMIADFFALSNDEYRFDAYYIKYKNNEGTEISDSVQDLIGNMSRTDQVIKYQIDFHNDVDYNVGDIEIRVPWKLYEDRNGTWVEPSDTGIPKAPAMNKTSSFHYSIDEPANEMVITNCKPIVAGTNNLMQIFYSLDDMATIDGTAWTIKPLFTIEGVDQASDITLTGSMDTKVVLESVNKTAYKFYNDISSCYPELYTLKQIEEIFRNKIQVTDEIKNNFDDYRYMLWKTTVVGYADQPYALEIKDTPGQGGIVIGQILRNPENYHYDDAAAGDTLSWAEKAQYGIVSDEIDDIYRTAQVLTVTAHPKDQVIANQDMVTNEISVTMTGVDDQEVHRISSNAQWKWEDFHWTYAGDMIGVDKGYGSIDSTEESWLTVYKKKSEAGIDTQLPHEWRVEGIYRGYDLVSPTSGAGKSYQLVTVDDVQYAKGSGGSYVKLTKDDYYYSSALVRITDYDMDKWEEKYLSKSEGEPVIVSVMTSEAGYEDVWQKVAEVSYKTALNGYRLPREWLDKEVYRIKAEHNSDDYETRCSLRVLNSIKADSPVMKELLGKGSLSVTIQNLGGVYGLFDGAYTQDQGEGQYDQYKELGLLDETKKLYGTVLMRDADTVTLTDIEETNSIRKRGKGVNRPESSQVGLKYRISARDGYLIYSGEACGYLEDSGITAARDKVTIYDFLPAGIRFDPTRMPKAGRTNRGYFEEPLNTRNYSLDYHVTDDYHGSGRQLVTFEITYTGADSSEIIENDWVSKFEVEFYAFYDWADIGIADGAENIAAFQTPDAMKGTANPDNGNGAPASAGGYLYDLDDDSDLTERNVIYTGERVYLDNAVSAQASIEKLVKEDANLFGEPEREAEGVNLGQTYTYTLTLTNGNNKSKDLVLFDLLEQAPGMSAGNDTMAFEPNYWYGTFVKTNTDLLKKKGIQVKVYYNRERNAKIKEAEKTGKEILEDQANGWVAAEDWSGTAADVKAVAYDLTTYASGQPFVLKEMDMLQLTIQMKAPNQLQNNAGGGNTAALDPASPATYAYNNPAYYATIETTGGVASDTTIGNATSIKMYDKTSLSVWKKEVTGREGTFDEKFSFTVKIAGKPYSYRTYQLYDADGSIVKGIYATDAQGNLSLKEGQKALFESVPAGAAYEVKENASLRWEPIATGAQGTLLNGQETKAEFTNQYTQLVYFEKEIRYTTASTNRNDVFTFELYRNDRLAGNHPYYIVDPSVDIKKDPVVRFEKVTDANGRFQLKAGERIVVKLAEGDKWKFVEVAGFGDGTDYTNTTPSTEGQIGKDDVLTEIVNDYRWKDLCISKEIQVADGEDPSLRTDEFQFEVRLGETGELYANQEYEVSDAKGRPVPPSPRTTDQNGILTLMHGQTARIRKLLQETPYTVTEKLSEEQKKEYDIIAPFGGRINGRLPKYADSSKVLFKNRLREKNLEIKKQVISDDMVTASNQEFQFKVYIGEPGTGELPSYQKEVTIKKTDGTEAVISIGSDGIFKLKSGEKAVIRELRYGTKYKVEEIPTSGYTQMQPANGQPAEGIMEESTAPTEVLFTNLDESTRAIVINKKAIPGRGVTQEMLDGVYEYLWDDEMSWESEMRDGLGFQFEIHVNGQPYRGTFQKVNYKGMITTETYWTDRDYCMLAPTETIIITGLKKGDTWEIKEPGARQAELRSKVGRVSGYWRPVSPENGIAAGVMNDGTVTLDFVNEVEEDTKMLIVHKSVDGKVSQEKQDSIALKATEYPNLIGKTLVYQLFKNNGKGGWEIASNEPYWLVKPEPGEYRYEPGIYYTDEMGRIRLTAVQNGEMLDGLVFALKVNKRWDEYDYDLGGWHDSGKQTYYRLIEDAKETDPFFGEFQEITIDHAVDGMPVFHCVNKSIPELETFFVEKKVEGSVGLERPFVFKLTRQFGFSAMGYETPEDTKVMANQQYRLFDRLTGAEIKESQPFWTDSEGRFSLKSGQYAQFENMPGGVFRKYGNTMKGGAVYGIKEEPVEGYAVSSAVVGVPSIWKTKGRIGWIAPGYTEGIVFTNTYNSRPNLEIEKKVTSEPDDYPYSNTFSFELKVDGRPYAEQEYSLYDEDGAPVLNKKTVNGITVNVPWMTDRYGEFKLKTGEKAIFEWVGTGKSYEVKEMEKAGYTQVQPAAGTSAVGTIPSTGSKVQFINHQGQKAGTITVRKNLSFPVGLEQPKDLTFTFRMEVSGGEYAGQSFEAYHNDGTIANLDGTTNAAGEFQLGAGQYAVFHDVPVGVDYSVKEVIDANAGYYLISSGNTEGATTAEGQVVTFTNGMASFLVTKKVTSATEQLAPEDDVFTFAVQSEGAPLANTTYWIYDGNGVKTGEGITDGAGRFTLTAKQRALFIKLPKGSTYQVKEEVKADYTQVVPADTNGYRGTIKDTVPELIFENDYNKMAALRVTKKVTEEAGVKAPADTWFTFRLEVRDKPFANRVYKKGTETFKTDANGRFKLLAGETAVFETVSSMSPYKITEEEIPRGFLPDKDTAEGVMDSEKGAWETVTNHYYGPVTIWVENLTEGNAGGFVQVEGDNPTNPNRVSSDGNDNHNDNRKESNIVSGAPEKTWTKEWSVDVPNITVGTKDGAKHPISTGIYDPQTGTFEVTVENGYVIKGTVTVAENGKATVEIEGMLEEIDVGIPFVSRDIGFILPETGGIGTGIYTTAGVAILLFAGLLYNILKRKRRKKR